MIPLWHYLVVAAILFGIGLVGFLTRRNLITMFLCAELMLQGVVINLLAFGRFQGTLNGQVIGLFVITVAACEAGLAMALFLMLYKRGKTLDSGDWLLSSSWQRTLPQIRWRANDSNVRQERRPH